MAHLDRQQIDGLRAGIEAHEFLQRLRDAIAELHRVVFHTIERADWELVQRSADQILMAEIVTRHGGRADGPGESLGKLQARGKSYDDAVQEVAAAIHSYFTTPLGVVMRQDLFGPEAVFITPDAHHWRAKVRGTSEDGRSAS